MARTEITIQNATTAGLNPAYAAADATNDMLFVNDGKTLLHIKNAGAGAVNVTVVSVPCSHGRTGDLVVNIPAGEERVIGVLKKELFNQTGAELSKVFVDFDVDTSVTVATLKF